MKIRMDRETYEELTKPWTPQNRKCPLCGFFLKPEKLRGMYSCTNEACSSRKSKGTLVVSGQAFQEPID